MYKYSPIERILVKDFRTVHDVQIDFKESPIVALVGGNDAGKTSILKAFEVCSLHYNSRGQKAYIKDGAQFFGVGIQLADGTSVVRMKTKDNINKYEVRYPDGTVWNTTKISEGLPVQVSEVMGMVEEPETKEYLQVRTYENQLLLAYTPSSTNYKVMYEALKVGQITRAVRSGTDEANDIKQKIIENAASMRALERSANKIAVIDIDGLKGIRDTLGRIKDSVKKIAGAIEIADKIEQTKEQLGVLRLIDTYELEEVNEIEASKLNNASSLANSLNEVSKELCLMKDVNDLETINVLQLEHIMGAVNSRNCLEEVKKERERVSDIDSAEFVDENIARMIEQAINEKERLETVKNNSECYTELDKLDTIDNDIDTIKNIDSLLKITESIRVSTSELESVKSGIERMTELLKMSGARVEICPNCGTEIVIETE